MSRYIDEDKVLEKLYDTQLYDSDDNILFEEILDNTPTADVQEVKYGKNVTDINPVDEFICSECGFICKELSGYDKEEDVHYEYEPKFCPECGAKMDNGGEQK